MVKFSRRDFLGGAAALFGASGCRPLGIAGGRPIGSVVLESKPGKDKAKRS